MICHQIGDWRLLSPGFWTHVGVSTILMESEFTRYDLGDLESKASDVSFEE
jgi:hypothetical protein